MWSHSLLALTFGVSFGSFPHGVQFFRSKLACSGCWSRYPPKVCWCKSSKLIGAWHFVISNPLWVLDLCGLFEFSYLPSNIFFVQELFLSYHRRLPGFLIDSPPFICTQRPLVSIPHSFDRHQSWDALFSSFILPQGGPLPSFATSRVR